jgi:DNA repair exonuclease SbcCD ATPase subunit
LNPAKIKNLGLRIQQQRELNTVIEDFIKQGLEIVNQSHKSNCPLCDQQFSSYEKLAEQITSNRALNDQLQTLLQESSELNQQLTRIKEEIQGNERILIAFGYFGPTMPGISVKPCHFERCCKVVKN